MYVPPVVSDLELFSSLYTHLYIHIFAEKSSDFVSLCCVNLLMMLLLLLFSVHTNLMLPLCISS